MNEYDPTLDEWQPGNGVLAIHHRTSSPIDPDTVWGYAQMMTEVYTKMGYAYKRIGCSTQTIQFDIAVVTDNHIYYKILVSTLIDGQTIRLVSHLPRFVDALDLMDHPMLNELTTALGRRVRSRWGYGRSIWLLLERDDHE